MDINKRSVITITLDESCSVRSNSSIPNSDEPVLIDLAEDDNDGTIEIVEAIEDKPDSNSSTTQSQNPSGSILKESNSRSKNNVVNCGLIRNPVSLSDGENDNDVCIITDDEECAVNLTQSDDTTEDSSPSCRKESSGTGKPQSVLDQFRRRRRKRFKRTGFLSASQTVPKPRSSVCQQVPLHSETSDVIILEDSMSLADSKPATEKNEAGCSSFFSARRMKRTARCLNATESRKKKAKTEKQNTKTFSDLLTSNKLPKCYQPISPPSENDDEVVVLSEAQSNLTIADSSKSGQMSIPPNKDSSWRKPAHMLNKLINLTPPVTNKKQSTDAKSIDVGSNVFVPDCLPEKTGPRPVFIDGCNVAFSHGRNSVFSAKGIEICVEYFKKLGNKVYVVLPNHRKGLLMPETLNKWEADGTLVTTPSRRINKTLVAADDDRYLIQCAAALDGVIVTSDQYRNYLGMNKLWDETIKKRLLMLTWIGDMLIFPDDPLGRHGPNLRDFLNY